MLFTNFTPQACAAYDRAGKFAKFCHENISVSHIALALIQQADTNAARVLLALRVTEDRLKLKLASYVQAECFTGSRMSWDTYRVRDPVAMTMPLARVTADLEQAATALKPVTTLDVLDGLFEITSGSVKDLMQVGITPKRIDNVRQSPEVMATALARETLAYANGYASLESGLVDPCHVLMSLLRWESNNDARTWLAAAQKKTVGIQVAIIKHGYCLTHRSAGDIMHPMPQFAPSTKQVLESARQLAYGSERRMSTLDLLSALAASQTLAGEIVRQAGVTQEVVADTLPTFVRHEID